MRVLFIGQNTPYSLAVLAALRPRHEVVGMVESARAGAAPASPWRRRLQRLAHRPALGALADRARVPSLFLTRDSLGALAPFARACGAHVGVIASCPVLLPPAVLEAFPGPLFNVHPSLLPDYRGPAPFLWQYLRGETRGGVTVHRVDPGEDTGDVAAQAPLPLPFATDGWIFMRSCGALGGTLAAQTLDDLQAGRLVLRAQPPAPNAFRARRLRPGETPIDWVHTPLEQAFHALRGAVVELDRLLPPRPFPLGACTLTAWRFTRGRRGRAAPGTYGWSGGGVTLAHAEGELHFRARPSPRRALAQLR